MPSSKGNYILFEVRHDDIHHDPYGTAMRWVGAIADVMVSEGEPVPGEWQYRPGASVDTESYEYETVSTSWLSGYIDIDDITFAGNVLSRFLDYCEMNGRSY